MDVMPERLCEALGRPEVPEAQETAGSVSRAAVDSPEDVMRHPPADYPDEVLPGEHRRMAADPMACLAQAAELLDAAFDSDIRETGFPRRSGARLDEVSRDLEQHPGREVSRDYDARVRRSTHMYAISDVTSTRRTGCAHGEQQFVSRLTAGRVPRSAAHRTEHSGMSTGARAACPEPLAESAGRMQNGPAHQHWTVAEVHRWITGPVMGSLRLGSCRAPLSTAAEARFRERWPGDEMARVGWATLIDERVE